MRHARSLTRSGPNLNRNLFDFVAFAPIVQLGHRPKLWQTLRMRIPTPLLALLVGGTVFAPAKDYLVHTFHRVQLSDKFWCEGYWTKHVVSDVTDNESPTFTDLTKRGTMIQVVLFCCQLHQID